MEAYKREFIEFLQEAGVLKFGDFTAKSGRKIPYFVNAGMIKTGDQITKMGEFYAKAYFDKLGNEVLNELNAELEKLYIPKTITFIEKGAFDGCETLNTIIFEHSSDEFKKITIEEDLSRFALEFDASFSEIKKEEKAK